MDYPKMRAEQVSGAWNIQIWSVVADVNGNTEVLARVPHYLSNQHQLARLFAASGEMLNALERIAELRDLWEAEHALTGPEAELLALADAAIMAAAKPQAQGGE